MALQSGVKQCPTCPNVTRPSRSSLADYPGTVARGPGGGCATCKSRANRAASLLVKPPSDETPANRASLENFLNKRRLRIADLNRKAMP